MESDKSKLSLNNKNAWIKTSESQKSKIDKFSFEYIDFLSNAKTEREVHDYAVELLDSSGFASMSSVNCLQPGSKVYKSFLNKYLIAVVIGTKDFQEGINIIGSHIDSPRLDTKPNPLYEDGELCMFDTHYYGGIKKYQWVSIPLAIHATIIKESGEKVSFIVGEDEEDPVFVISDLLPHLSKDQEKKNLAEGITGENLNLLVGSCPIDDDKLKQKVKENVLKILNEKYYIVEEDFCSAEIQIVPAGKARELGFDKSMVLGYGQDDRICAFASLKALSELKEIPEKTSVVILCDKEETGSQGATGMSSFVFENIVAELINMRCENYSDLMLRRCLQNSNMLSADVSSAHDPNYADVSAPNNNMAKLGYGIVIRKYTGARGKVHTNEAEPEFFARLRKIFNENKIVWQTAELGKVDLGGGGTIAAELARYGMNVIDCGPCLLNMHAPWEISSKIDAYITYEAYGLFYKLI